MNAEKKNFYGWILLVAIGIMFLCSSGFILVGASVVNPLMMADSSMNMNATLMGLGFTLFVLCQGIPAPLIGQFITKYGQKKTFIVGGLLLIIGGLLMAFVVKTTIGYLIAFGVILSIGSQMAGQVTMQTSVSAWFVQKRALAMSIATVIGAIGSFISPRILNSIVASTGRWQDAWLLVAGLGVMINSCEVYLENVVLDESALVGKKGRGFFQLMKNFEVERLMSTAMNVGMAQAAYEEAARYATERVQFGKTIGSFQLTQEKIINMAIKIENMRNMVYHYAWMKQNGMSIATESAMAKYYTSRAAFEVVDDAMQIMGGIGYTNDVRIARLWRDCRLSRIMAGTDEIMVHIAGRALLKEFANK